MPPVRTMSAGASSGRVTAADTGLSLAGGGPSPTRRPSNQGATISRKIRACQNCQARKIKCDILPGQSSCTRCTRNGLDCVVKKSLQTLLDDENEWKNGVEQQLRQLSTALANVQSLLGKAATQTTYQAASHNNFPQPGTEYGAEPLSSSITPSSTCISGAAPLVVTAMTRENSPESLAGTGACPSRDEGAIGGAPAASLFEVTKLRNIRNDPASRTTRRADASYDARSNAPDFIDHGRVTIVEAEGLFENFKGRLNGYIWGGVGLRHGNLAEVRASSPLLAASILAVAALHRQDQGEAFDRCYPIFLELVGHCMFQRYHSLDDVRALCIGAFWLSDVSWKLSGLAVRIATELGLHKQCMKALGPNGPADGGDVEGTRLWFFLYLCDHHFSTAYGRPPAIHEDMTITKHELFLQLPGAKPSDYRIHSQVALFLILNRAYLHFRPDLSKVVASDEFDVVRRFDAELERWRQTWLSALVPDPNVADYPRKGVRLHYHFARLQLLSMCMRGIKPSDLGSSESFLISPDRRAFIRGAIESAMSALRMILDDEDLRHAIIGMPFYLLTSITYAAIFLMKVHSEWRVANFDLSYPDVIDVLHRMISLLRMSSACPKHVAFHIGKGLDAVLGKFKQREEAYQQWQSESRADQNSSSDGQDLPGVSSFPQQFPRLTNMPAQPAQGAPPAWNVWVGSRPNMPAQSEMPTMDMYPFNMLDVFEQYVP